VALFLVNRQFSPGFFRPVVISLGQGYVLDRMSTPLANSNEVNLFGQKLVLKSSDTDPEVIQEVLKMVSTRVSEAEKRGKGAPPHQVALLALLDLAEEYVQARKRTLEYQRQIEEKSSLLINLVELSLQ
jgi:cell division protein ZapA (FtsZ GTPase activity inhibitor)